MVSLTGVDEVTGTVVRFTAGKVDKYSGDILSSIPEPVSEVSPSVDDGLIVVS